MGGAAVAILAYLGNVAGKGYPVPDMHCPMAAFLAGLVLCGLAMFLSYWIQLRRLNRLAEKIDPKADWSLLIIAGACAFLSLTAFGTGVISCRHVIQMILRPPAPIPTVFFWRI